MRAVRPIFQRIISKTPTAPAEAPEANDLEIFNDQKRAVKAFADLAQSAAGFHIAPRTRQIFGKLRPVVIGWLSKAADPDATLNQFVRFVEAYGMRSLLFELLVANPRLLELLLKTFDASRFAGDLLIRRPHLLEDTTRDPAFHQARSVVENLRRLELLGANANDLDPIRAYRQRQLLRIILREVLGLASPSETFTELSDVAEACLVFTARLLGNDQLTIIALGKFGGRELSYGADLDVLFVGDDSRATQNFVIAVTQPTAEGNIWPLDARLRPEGEKGPLVCSLETYQWYYTNRARPWELQALTRARAITGPLQNEFMELAKRVWRRASQHADLLPRIDVMLERIRRERGTGSDFLDLKTGRGGLIEAEFLIQALQMRENIWEQNLGRAIDRLHQQGYMTDAEVAEFKDAYGLLRRCELVLRGYENRSVSTLPNHPDEQRKFAVRLGYHELEAFRRDYVNARDTIHLLYESHIAAASPLRQSTSAQAVDSAN
jgi:glutamate-ammonia-ligase adenylyltransferase